MLQCNIFVAMQHRNLTVAKRFVKSRRLSLQEGGNFPVDRALQCSYFVLYAGLQCGSSGCRGRAQNTNNAGASDRFAGRHRTDLGGRNVLGRLLIFEDNTILSM